MQKKYNRFKKVKVIKKKEKKKKKRRKKNGKKKGKLLRTAKAQCTHRSL